MHTKQEQIKLWGNDKGRRAFVKTYKDWGVWLEIPELKQTFYRYALPNGHTIVVMEHPRKNYSPGEGEDEFVISPRYFLQKETYFIPDASSDYAIADELKNLKQQFLQEAKKAQANGDQ